MNPPNRPEQLIQETAARHGITPERSFIDDWTDRSSAMAGQDGTPANEIQQLLTNMIRSGAVEARKAFDLHVSYMGPVRSERSGFDPFSDFGSEGYLRNFAKLSDGRQISDHERLACTSFSISAAEHLKGRRHLAYSDVLRTHVTLFGHVYPWAGKDRFTTAPHLIISKAGLGNIFALPGHERRAMEYALQQGANTAIMRSKPGEIMGHMAHSHPFLDGNGRTFMLVHNELCRRSGFHVDWMSIDPGVYLRTLTHELQDPGSGALDRLLKPYLVMKPLDLTSFTS